MIGARTYNYRVKKDCVYKVNDIQPVIMARYIVMLEMVKRNVA
jgi:hypothetical protein